MSRTVAQRSHGSTAQPRSAPDARSCPGQLQRAADGSPPVARLDRLQALATQCTARSHADSTAQRILDGTLKDITAQYLDRFKDRFPALGRFNARNAVLARLKEMPDILSSDTDLEAALPKALAHLRLPADTVAKSANAADTPKAGTKGAPERPAPVKGASPERPPEPQILSTSPAKAASTRSLAPVVDVEPPAEETPESLRVTALYEAGHLLVTSVQRKDLAKVHKASAVEAVGSHAVDGQIRMGAEDLGGDLANAKVNWTLTSPAMKPHYYGMTVDDKDRSPKPDNGTPVGAPRVATLADPTAMGARFMRGKEGREDFSDWDKDQSSSKTAGVADKAPLYPFTDPGVRARFETIKQEQETEYRDTNPEINTFGFPPDAIVGFLVTSGNEADMKAVRDAKAAMSPEQRERSFPVMSWESAGDKQWRLKVVAYV